VETLEAADRAIEYALAALGVDIVLEIAGHGCDDLDPLAGKEVGEVFLALHFQNGQVAAIHHAHAEAACGAHQGAEMRVELGGAPGDVERPPAPPREKGKHRLDRLA